MNKFENLHELQRKISTRVLLPDARPSCPILAVKKITYIQALRLNTVQPVGPLAFFIMYVYINLYRKVWLKQVSFFQSNHWPAIYRRLS